MPQGPGVGEHAPPRSAASRSSSSSSFLVTGTVPATTAGATTGEAAGATVAPLADAALAGLANMGAMRLSGVRGGGDDRQPLFERMGKYATDLHGSIRPDILFPSGKRRRHAGADEY